MIIKDIKLRKIIDSRGNSTVEADISTNDGFGRAAAPAGASTGTFEAQAWPENNVDLGISNARRKLIPLLTGIPANDQKAFDETIKERRWNKKLTECRRKYLCCFILSLCQSCCRFKKHSTIRAC